MLFGAWYRLKSLASFVHPTYGNTMYHTGMVRLIVQTGMMPVYSLSYGGFTKSFYVPAYRLFVASLSLLSNTDPVVAASLFVIAMGIVATLAAYLLGREFGGTAVGLASAFLFVLSPELTIYTIRAFPEVLGIPLFLLTLYFLHKRNMAMAVLSAVLTTMSHQATAIVLGAVLLVYSIVKRDKIAAAALVSSIAAYSAWQLYALGSLDILSMRQIALKESGAVTAQSIERIGVWALLFAPFGLVYLLKSWRKHLLLLGFAAATLLLAKNEMLGIGIFTDRLFTFFALSLVFVAAFGMKLVWGQLEGVKWK